MGGEGFLTQGDWVVVNGKKTIMQKGMKVADLMEAIGVSSSTHIAIVNGRPAPEDYPLLPGDIIEFLMFTVHKEMGGAKG
jgi:sulfur carrier protein ThiS